MKYVKIEAIDGGFFLDPYAYIAQLAEISARLPVGAAAFAGDPEHYDFSSPRCVKDLEVGSMTLTDSDGLSLTMVLEPNQFKHETGLIVEYLNVSSVALEGADLRDLQLDEILPHEDGCSHEISFVGGSLTVVCGDLSARWLDHA